MGAISTWSLWTKCVIKYFPAHFTSFFEAQERKTHVITQGNCKAPSCKYEGTKRFLDQKVSFKEPNDNF